MGVGGGGPSHGGAERLPVLFPLDLAGMSSAYSIRYVAPVWIAKPRGAVQLNVTYALVASVRVGTAWKSRTLFGTLLPTVSISTLASSGLRPSSLNAATR